MKEFTFSRDTLTSLRALDLSDPETIARFKTAIQNELTKPTGEKKMTEIEDLGRQIMSDDQDDESQEETQSYQPSAQEQPDVPLNPGHNVIVGSQIT